MARMTTNLLDILLGSASAEFAALMPLRPIVRWRYTVARIACLSVCRRFSGVGENRPRTMPVSTDRDARTCLAQAKTEALATHDNDDRIARHVCLVLLVILNSLI